MTPYVLAAPYNAYDSIALNPLGVTGVTTTPTLGGNVRYMSNPAIY